MDYSQTMIDWYQMARDKGIHPVEINEFVAQDFCPNCGGKFGEFPEGESAIPHFLGLCKAAVKG